MATEQQAAQTAENNNSMRDDIERALGAIENDEEGAITTETEGEAALEAGDLFKHEETEEAEAEAKVEAEAEEILGKESELEDKPADEDGVPDAAGDVDDLAAAPVSWTPAAREEWAKLPETVKKQVAKREHQIDIALNDGAEARKTGEGFKAITDQYAQVIAAEGATDALTGVSELMKTVATLRMGNPQQKATRIAQFIDHYGIDINMLDGILSEKIGGGQPASSTGDPNLEAIINERMAPVNKLLAQMDESTKRQNFESNQKLMTEVVAFKQDHEFYEDVQNDMADMVEMAAKRRNIMPLQEAYDKACAMNPEISKVLKDRADAEELLNGKQTLEQKREAASSIMGKQGAPAGQEDMNLHDTIAAAWDAQTG